jgi:hypothetical protein
VLFGVIVFGPIFGAESRPQGLDVDGKPRFRMSGSMRRSNWPPSELDP